MLLVRHLSLLVALVGLAPTARAQTYQKPPQAVLDVLHAPLPPTPVLSPTRRHLALARPVRYPPVADLAVPMLRLAGVRIDPRTNAEHGAAYWVSLSVMTVPDGAERPVRLPADARIGVPRWSADGAWMAFTNSTARGVELWVVDVATLRARRIPGVQLNPVLGGPLQWMADHRTLLVKTVPPRGAAPQAPAVPPGPRVRESTGRKAVSSTYEARDLLTGPADEARFDFHATSQLARVHAPTGKVTRVGAPGVIASVQRSPDGRYLLVQRLVKPYSYLRTWPRFPRSVEVWTAAGARVETVATLPLHDRVPIDGVAPGPRWFGFRPTAPATLTWFEALDGGDPARKATHRDRVMMRAVGQTTAAEIARTEHRATDLDWIAGSGRVLLREHDRDRKWNRTHLLDADAPGSKPRLVWDLSAHERYRHPGHPVYAPLPSGAWAVMEKGGAIWLQGQGATPAGARPFLDRLDLGTLRTTRLHRSDPKRLEYFVAWLDPAAGTFISHEESPTTPPTLHLRTLSPARRAPAAVGEAEHTTTARPLTRHPDPTPQLRGITKQLVTYRRADGIPLSFTLYLPPGYKPGTRLPTVVWAYPLDYASASAAGQVTGSPLQFTRFWSTSPLFFLLQGYAVLNDVAMPVVGPPGKIYDRFLEQLEMNAKAAIDKAVALGVTDPDRVGVMGHSHGALMTVNLLAHTNLFRAGIARSGAFNRTLTAFGFQNEKRTLWQAREVYFKVSPFMHAEKIDEPLLLIHGEVDRNPGTVPLQSEKLHEALHGLGGTVRLVMLPHEDHGYRARESVEHVLWEMLTWFDRHVKRAPPRRPAAGSTAPTGARAPAPARRRRSP
jgi:dipeptidyl aminopeptidase/acylaminoacyl peptidase